MKYTLLISLILLLNLQTLTAREERVRLNLKFSFMKAGEAEMTFTDTMYNGRAARHFHVLAKTTGLAEKFYGVFDIYETTVDAESYLPLKTIRNVKEGSYRQYEETYFFHDNDSIFSDKRGGRKVPDNLVDLISVLFYFIHNHSFENLAPGDAVVYPMINAGKISDIIVQYLREEVVETELGKVNCYVLNPTMDKGNVLNKTNGVHFYVSKDKKLPVFVNFDMRVGSLKAEIRSYTVDGEEQMIR